MKPVISFALIMAQFRIKFFRKFYFRNPFKMCDFVFEFFDLLVNLHIYFFCLKPFVNKLIRSFRNADNIINQFAALEKLFEAFEPFFGKKSRLSIAQFHIARLLNNASLNFFQPNTIVSDFDVRFCFKPINSTDNLNRNLHAFRDQFQFG
ncbi:hypothetical protein D3C71_1278950 [compost metagenome]